MRYLFLIIPILLIFTVSLVIYGFFGLLLFILVKFLKKQQFGKYFLSDKFFLWFKYLLIIVIVTLAVKETYFAYFPENKFYKNEFKEITGITLPKKVKILAKAATFPDHFGDYSSSALFQLSPNTFNSLSKVIISQNSNCNDNFGSDALSKVLSKVEIQPTIHLFAANRDEGGCYKYWGLDTLSYQCLIHYCSQ